MKLSSAEPNCCLKNTRGFLDGKRRSNATHCDFRNKISYHKKPVGRGCQNAVALQNIEERYRALADATFESVFISENGICIEANQTATKMFGYDYDELIGVFGTDVIAPESKELVRHNMLSEYEEPYEALALRKDGTTFRAEIRGKMAEYKGKKVRVTVVHDIDAYKRAAAALQESEERFRTLVEYAPLGFSIMKPDRTFEYFNPKFTETFGYTLEDIPNKAVWFENQKALSGNACKSVDHKKRSRRLFFNRRQRQGVRRAGGQGQKLAAEGVGVDRHGRARQDTGRSF